MKTECKNCKYILELQKMLKEKSNTINEIIKIRQMTIEYDYSPVIINKKTINLN